MYIQDQHFNDWIAQGRRLSTWWPKFESAEFEAKFMRSNFHFFNDNWGLCAGMIFHITACAWQVQSLKSQLATQLTIKIHCRGDICAC